MEDEAGQSISFGEEALRVGDASIPWGDLLSVGIRTTADGPWAEDFFWIFARRDGAAIELPGGVLSTELLEVLQHRLPGLDDGKIIEAMGSTAERVFHLWHHDHPTRPDPDALRARFVDLVGELQGDTAASAVVGDDLLARWGDPSRRYHDLEHLADCLRELDAVSAVLQPAERMRVELALWYHDAVYVPRSSTSEAESAQLALTDAPRLGLDEALAADVARLVRATAHLGRPAGEETRPDEDLIIDVDLAILGQEPLRFLEFEYGVREEYARVPAPVYFFLRRRFLASLLRSDRIFRTPAFRDRYEARARANLEALLGSPRYRWWRWLC